MGVLQGQSTLQHESGLPPLEGVISSHAPKREAPRVPHQWRALHRVRKLTQLLQRLFLANESVAPSPHTWEYVARALLLHFEGLRPHVIE